MTRLFAALAWRPGEWCPDPGVAGPLEHGRVVVAAALAGWSVMGLFRDRAAERSQEASARRKVEKMNRSPKVAAGRSIPDAPAPHTCGARCDGFPNGCPSTVRGGVCPCRYC